MQNARRVARELALKTLFQVDVGKHALDTVLDGALGQVRVNVEGPVQQTCQRAHQEVRSSCSQATSELSSQMKGAVTRQGTLIIGELNGFADALTEITRSACAPGTWMDVAAADRRADEALANAQGGLTRVERRDLVPFTLIVPALEIARQALEQMHLLFRKNIATTMQTAAFFSLLVKGVLEKQSEIDERITALAAGWALERQAAVDRNIMRLAAFEVLFVPDIPTGASINEAVELAKKYSTAESGRFVNGVLGALAGNNGQASVAPPEEAAVIAPEDLGAAELVESDRSEPEE